MLGKFLRNDHMLLSRRSLLFTALEHVKIRIGIRSAPYVHLLSAHSKKYKKNYKTRNEN